MMDMTDDQLFGEKDTDERVKELESENKRLQGKVKRLKAFLVEQGLAIDYLKWNRGDE